MKAADVRAQIQAILGTKPDGVISAGGETMRAFQQLVLAQPGDPWPPVSGAAFAGQYTPALRDQYARLFGALEIRDDWKERIARKLAAIGEHEQRYGKVADLLCQQGSHFGDPAMWLFIGILHAMECDLDFSQHLHNGDPLTARTVQVPAGRPSQGSPPFAWEVSALDALVIKGLQAETDWSVPRMLYHFERFNGWGYRKFHPAVLSPYLWSGSTHYRVGKYARDGAYNPELTSAQAGAACLLHAAGYRA